MELSIVTTLYCSEAYVDDFYHRVTETTRELTEDYELIFVNVISASGARYVSGARTWWVKGDDAILTDDMSDAEPVTCAAQGATTFQ